MDVNSPEAALWSENMSLKSQNEHLRSVMAPLRSEAAWMIGQLKVHGYTGLKQPQAAVDAATAVLEQSPSSKEK